MKELSHTDEHGRAKMVDVGSKPDMQRRAVAIGFISLQKETIGLIKQNMMKKGDVISVAEIAGIQAAKNTASLIPLCHPLMISNIEVNTSISNKGVHVESIVGCKGQTGVEMEALTAVSVALLTIYDMCKAVDKSMIISDIKLTDKTKK